MNIKLSLDFIVDISLPGNERTNDVTLTLIAIVFIAVQVSDVSVEDCNTEMKNIINKVSSYFLLIFNVQVLAQYDPLNEYTERNLSTTVFNMSRVLQPPVSLPGKCSIC